MICFTVFVLALAHCLAQPDTFAQQGSAVPSNQGVPGQVPGIPTNTGVNGVVPGLPGFPAGPPFTSVPMPNQFNGGGNPLPVKKRSPDGSSEEDKVPLTASLAPNATTAASVPLMKRSADVAPAVHTNGAQNAMNNTTTKGPGR